MSQEQAQPLDTAMVSKVIEHEVDRMGRAEFLAMSSVSRSSLNKAIAGTLDFNSPIYDRIEHDLKLPDRTFQFIALGLHDDLARIRVRSGLIDWIKDGGKDPIQKKRTRGARTD